MKKVLMLLFMTAVLLGTSMVAKATVRTESLGLGAGADAALAVDDIDLVWLFPSRLPEFSNTAEWRYGVSNEPVNAYADWDVFNDTQTNVRKDNWGGVIDGKHGAIGVIGVYVNRPNTYFTHDLGNNPYLGLADTNNDYESFNEDNNINYGVVSNNWDDFVNGWRGFNYNYGSTGTTNNRSYQSLWQWQILAPQNKLDLLWAKELGGGVLGVQFNYGHRSGDSFNWYGLNNSSSTDGNNNAWAAGSFVDQQKAAEASSQFGAAVGFGKKDLGPFSKVDAKVSFETGSLDYADQELYRNNTNSGNYVRYDNTLKGDGIHDIQVGLLAVKDKDENNQMRVNAQAILTKFNTKEVQLWDSNNDGSFTDESNGNNQTRKTGYTGTILSAGTACVHKYDGGKGLVVVSLGVNYRTMKFTDDVQHWNAAAQRNDYDFKAEDTFTNITIPVAVGAEQKFTKWLTGRLGMNANLLQSYKEKATTYGNIVNGQYQDSEVDKSSTDPRANVKMTTGVGVNVGNWTLDMLIDQNFFEDTFLNSVRPGRGTLFTGDLATVAKAQMTVKF